MQMDKKLKEILDYVNEKSKFYRKIKQNNEENRNCLSEFPIMSKEVLYENYDEIICDTQEEIIFEYTSGSSGIPLKCQKTISERASASLAIWKRRRAIDEEVNINNSTFPAQITEHCLNKYWLGCYPVVNFTFQYFCDIG